MQVVVDLWWTADKAKAENRLRSTEVFKTLACLQKVRTQRNSAFKRMQESVQRYLNTERVSAGVVPPAARPLIHSIRYAHTGTTLNMWKEKEKHQTFDLIRTPRGFNKCMNPSDLHIILSKHLYILLLYIMCYTYYCSKRRVIVLDGRHREVFRSTNSTQWNTYEERAPCLIKAERSIS